LRVRGPPVGLREKPLSPTYALVGVVKIESEDEVVDGEESSTDKAV
jgi:hypothetical protein